MSWLILLSIGIVFHVLHNSKGKDFKERARDCFYGTLLITSTHAFLYFFISFIMMASMITELMIEVGRYDIFFKRGLMFVEFGTVLFVILIFLLFFTKFWSKITEKQKEASK